MPETPPVVLSIAGFDPSSGAGVTADIKTAAAHGCYCVTCVTAVTVQSTAGVGAVQALPKKLVAETLAMLAEDVPLAAVRIGMLGSGEVAEAVAEWLESIRSSGGIPYPSKTGLGGPPGGLGGPGPWVVLDPVLRSSSGTELLDKRGLEVMKERLLGLADVMTPNVDEATALSGVRIADADDMEKAALKLHKMGSHAVVVTGGHLSKPVDVLSVAGGKQAKFRGGKIKSRATHGTGCAFASALACNLARGFELKDSVKAAGAYVREAIAHAYPLGRGKGPVNHLYAMRES